MPRTLDLEQIVAGNAAVNVKELEEARKLREDLRRHRQNAKPETPSTRRHRARILDDLGSDPRVVRLHSGKNGRSR